MRAGRSFSESAEESFQEREVICTVQLAGSRGLGLSLLALWLQPREPGCQGPSFFCAHFLFLGIDFLWYLHLPSNLSSLFLFPFSWTRSACVHSWGGGSVPHESGLDWLEEMPALAASLEGLNVSWFGESNKLHTVFFSSWETLGYIFGWLLGGGCSSPTRLGQTQTCFS